MGPRFWVFLALVIYLEDYFLSLKVTGHETEGGVSCARSY